MAVTWENFYRLVQPHVSGCPEIVINEHLRDAAIDFCKRSEVWRYTLDVDITVEGLSEYSLDTPSGSSVENVLALYMDGLLLSRVSDLDHKVSPNHPASTPTSYALYQGNQVRFYPTPDAAYSFTGLCVLKPSITATGVEDFLFEAHGRTIAAGAVASITLTPGKEWTNNELAAYYAARFNKETDDAKGRDTRRAGLRVKSVNFA